MFDEKKAQAAFEAGYEEAEVLLNDIDKLERLLQRVEKKLKTIPVVGEQLAIVPTMVSLIRSYVKKEYKDVPIGTILATISAVSYFASPIDIVPDAVPVVGYVDDAFVITMAYKLIKSDIDEYDAWRIANGKKI